MRAPALAFAAAFLATAFAGCITPEPVLDDLSSASDASSLLSAVRFDSLMRETMDFPSSLDEVSLRVDVYRPEGDGPFPTILVLSPYWAFTGDAKTREKPTWYIDYFVPRGYAVALAEMRGTRDSGGCWDFGGERDQADGHDFVEGLAAQSWSNGKVGMLGQSHVGMSQIAAAVKAPEHLTTIVPIAAVSDWYRYLHKDGAPYVLNRLTPPAYFGVHASPSDPGNVSPDWALTQSNTACADNAIHLSKSGELDGDKDAYWQERDLISRAGNINTSVFLVHGFLDENVKTDHFLDLWESLPEGTPRKAWFGQWFHEHPPYEEWRMDLHRWFDHWLLGIENGIMDEPAVTVQTNDRSARAESAWPSASTLDTRFMLTADGIAPEENGTATASVTYLAIPGRDRGSTPQVAKEAAMMTTGVLDAPLHIGGEPVLELEGTLDSTAGRWIAVLFDVAPDGAMDEVTRAYLDARHRDSLETGKDVPMGTAQSYTLRFFPRDHVVPAGHELRLAFLGADMGCQAMGSGTCEGTGIIPVERPVTHTVHVGPGSGTRLILPVVGDVGAARELTDLSGWLSNLPP